MIYCRGKCSVSHSRTDGGNANQTTKTPVIKLMNIITPNIPSHTVCIGFPHSLQIRLKATKGWSSHFPQEVQVTLIFPSMTKMRLLRRRDANARSQSSAPLD